MSERTFGPLDPPEKNSSCTKALSVLFACISLILLGVSLFLAFCLQRSNASVESLSTDNAVLTNKITSLESRLSRTTASLNSTKQEFDDAQFELQFWENNAVIVTTTGTKYHTYGCFHLGDNPFYIYNKEAAIVRGYTPCMDCDPDATESHSADIVPVFP